jgi:type IV pilus assembly protein PilE
MSLRVRSGRIRRVAQAAARRGFSIAEIAVVLTVMGILLSLSMPTFRRALEQVKADIAVANLRAIWSAQRLYWLDARAPAPDLATLQAQNLIDPALVSSTIPYTYTVTALDANTWTAAASRTGSTVWQGCFVIDQTGLISGSLQAASEPAIGPAAY